MGRGAFLILLAVSLALSLRSAETRAGFSMSCEGYTPGTPFGLTPTDSQDILDAAGGFIIDRSLQRVFTSGAGAFVNRPTPEQMGIDQGRPYIRSFGEESSRVSTLAFAPDVELVTSVVVILTDRFE